MKRQYGIRMGTICHPSITRQGGNYPFNAERQAEKL